METQELKDKVIEVLKTIYDPEIPVNIYELGLVYTIDISDDMKLKVEMTLTCAKLPNRRRYSRRSSAKIKRDFGFYRCTCGIGF